MAWFAISVVAMGVVLASLARVWVDLPLWRVFRRCVSVAAAISLWVFLRYVHHQHVRVLGLGSFRQGRRQLLLGVVLGFSAVLVMGGIYLATHACRIAIHSDTLRVWRTVVGFLPAAGLIAVLEELIFRGYVFQQFLACSRWLALGGSSAAYAVVHLRPSAVWPSSALEFIGLFILGWVLAVSVLSTRQLYLAIGLHAAFAYGARVNKLLVEFTAPSLQWLVGTSRLVNGVAAWLVLLLVGWIVARWVKAPTGAEG